MKKGYLLFIAILILLFSFPLKSNAAELYGTNVYIFHDMYNGSSIYEQEKIQYSYSYESSSPMTVYLMEDISAPSSTYINVIYFVVSDSMITRSDGDQYYQTIIDKDGKTKYMTTFGYSRTYARPYTARIYMTSTGAEKEIKLKQYYTIDEFITNYQNGSLNYDVPVDWENMQYNETIGFLQNVMLKASGSLNKDFEITWSNNDWQFQDDEFRVQIGYHTRFQETLFGELRLYTDLDYISWDDGLYYSTGKWSCNVDDLFTAIPNCNHPAYTGNFYLRIVRVNSSTGSVEYGPWGQLSWVIHKSPDDGGRAVSSEYVTLKNSNVFCNDGVTDLYDEQYEIDSDSPTSQKYVVNTNNGSIDSFSTSTYDTLYNEFGELDFSKIGDYFTTGISSLYNSLHDFPTLVSKVASFLPKEIYAIIGISIVVIILCRVFGR